MDNTTKYPATKTVTAQYNRAGELMGLHEDSEEIEVFTFEVDPLLISRARVALGTTINMGDYESVRIDVSLEIPAYREELAQAVRWGLNACKKTIAAETEGIMSRAKGVVVSE